MKRENKKIAATMAYYLKKHRTAVFLGLLPTITAYGIQSGASLVTAQVFQGVFEGDLPGMFRWMLLLLRLLVTMLGAGAP